MGVQDKLERWEEIGPMSAETDFESELTSGRTDGKYQKYQLEFSRLEFEVDIREELRANATQCKVRENHGRPAVSVLVA